MPTVKESVAGTPARNTSEPAAQAQASPNGNDGLPAGQTVSSEKTITQAEFETTVRALKAEHGREKKVLEAENASLKSQLSAKESELADNTADIEKLQEKLDAMAADDPAKFDVAKELKAAREERRQLKAEKAALEAEKQAHGESVKLAQSTLREIATWEIAGEYEGGDFAKLQDLSNLFEAKTEDQIRKVADTLWKKKGTGTPAAPAKSGQAPVVTYSGQSDGGSDNIGGMSPKDRIKEADRRLRMK